MITYGFASTKTDGTFHTAFVMQIYQGKKTIMGLKDAYVYDCKQNIIPFCEQSELKVLKNRK